MPYKMSVQYGHGDGYKYAVKIKGLNNEFFKLTYPETVKDRQIVDKFIQAKDVVSITLITANKASLHAVKKWVKDNKPLEVYARWEAEPVESVLIFYRPQK